MNTTSFRGPAQLSPHLSQERLAAFDHEVFSALEQQHIESCNECRMLLEEFRGIVEQAKLEQAVASAENEERLVSWDTIASSLRAEDLIKSEVSFQANQLVLNTPNVRKGKPQWTRAWKQVAAMLLLVLGGAVLGRISGEFAENGGAIDPSVAVKSVENFLAGGTDEGPHTTVGTSAGFTSIEEATAAMARAQSDYEQAVMWLASNDSTTRSVEVYRARLAALDQMMAASRAALRDAPKDPVLSHYFITTWAAREATLQALGNSLPVDKTIERY